MRFRPVFMLARGLQKEYRQDRRNNTRTTTMSNHDITKFEKEIAECADPDELACKVKLVF